MLLISGFSSKNFCISFICLLSKILCMPILISLAGIPPIIEHWGSFEKSLLTKLLLETIVRSGIEAPAEIVQELHIQQNFP